MKIAFVGTGVMGKSMAGHLLKAGHEVVVYTRTKAKAEEQRMAAVKAECERNRGADCNNPSTLQYLDSTSIPRRGRY